MQSLLAEATAIAPDQGRSFFILDKLSKNIANKKGSSIAA